MSKSKSAIPYIGTDPRTGVYHAYWYDAAARQRRGCTLRTKDPAEATHRFAEFLLQGRDVYATPSLPGLRAPKALDDYYAEHVCDPKKGCVDKVRADLAIRTLKQHFTGLIKEIDIPMCRDYLAKREQGILSGRPVTAATVRRELVVLTAAVNHAVKWKRLTLADVPSIELPPDSEARERWLTRKEWIDLQAELRRRVATAAAAAVRVPKSEPYYAGLTVQAQRVHDFVLIAYYTASRRRAVENLTWFQVDLERKIINLAQPGERKTKKRRPVVRIDPVLLPTLGRLWDTKKDGAVLGGRGGVYRAFVKACQAIGIDDVSPHTLRHTRATHLLQDGEEIWDVAKLLGDTVATVEKNYGHHSPEYQRFLAEREEA